MEKPLARTSKMLYATVHDCGLVVTVWEPVDYYVSAGGAFPVPVRATIERERLSRLR